MVLLHETTKGRTLYWYFDNLRSRSYEILVEEYEGVRWDQMCHQFYSLIPLKRRNCNSTTPSPNSNKISRVCAYSLQPEEVLEGWHINTPLYGMEKLEPWWASEQQSKNLNMVFEILWTQKLLEGLAQLIYFSFLSDVLLYLHTYLNIILVKITVASAIQVQITFTMISMYKYKFHFFIRNIRWYLANEKNIGTRKIVWSDRSKNRASNCYILCLTWIKKKKNNLCVIQ